jgi:hypothetical protein
VCEYSQSQAELAKSSLDHQWLSQCFWGKQCKKAICNWLKRWRNLRAWNRRLKVKSTDLGPQSASDSMSIAEWISP